ncbi:hypothetical protein [Streptomyces sp. NEAU-H3]|uniref:hypothetical protein n=1 Tax=Streptomyces sp. NEAU-H3 TaxID=2720636 RepID=UPI00143CA8EB|nr:hypothetical protein [Streptomyces sp. NEAU-H3]NJA56710.1 hypothetical protein [Streptomyces sp. NEAU-H3]
MQDTWDRLRDFASSYRQPIGDTRARERVTGATRTAGSIPVSLDALDHLARTTAELDAIVHKHAPDAAPAPADAYARRDWFMEHTAHLDDDGQREARATVYRQGLEHAIAMGDDKVVRRHPCPSCGTWGLFWRPAARRAACVNTHCADANGGLPRTWSLARLAAAHTAREETRSRRAT